MIKRKIHINRTLNFLLFKADEMPQETSIVVNYFFDNVQYVIYK